MKETVFERLNKKTEIPEDYVTEAFRGAFLALEGDISPFLSSLLGEHIDLADPEIITQRTNQAGRMDLEVWDENHHIIFENKWDSDSYLDQLVHYDSFLDSNINRQFKILVHLTKTYEIIDESIFKNKFKKIAWSDVYDKLSKYNSDFYVRQFLQYLKNTGVVMEKVKWQLIEGAKSVFDLQKITARAAEELKLNVKWQGGSSGNTALLIDKDLYAWFFFDTSELCLAMYEPYNKDVFNHRQGSNYGCKRFDFDEQRFFHLSLEEQISSIKSFIKETMNKIQR